MQTRTFRTPIPVDLRRTLRPVRRGRADPTFRFAEGAACRGGRSPEGTFSIRIGIAGDRVSASAWGDGADWALEHAPELVGAHDRAEGFRSELHPVVARLAHRLPGVRIGRTRAVVEATVASVCEQKVTSFEAHRAWEQLVRRYGEPAPGPLGLLVAPEPAAVAGAPYYDLHVMGLERRRADTIRRVCAQAGRLDAADLPDPADLSARLQALPGVGPWTAAEVALVALGDPDAVSVGDYHLPHLVSNALAGEPRGDDDRMLELLEPFRGHRGRVIRLLAAGRLAPARRGPRMPPRSIARI